MTNWIRSHWQGLLAGWQEERGDVPGWVMICVMTAGLVGVIGVIAGDELSSMLREAINSVR